MVLKKKKEYREKRRGETKNKRTFNTKWVISGWCLTKEKVKYTKGKKWLVEDLMAGYFKNLPATLPGNQKS